MYMIFISGGLICVRSHISKFTSKDYDVDGIFRRDTFIFLWSWLSAIALRLYNVFGAPAHFFIYSEALTRDTRSLCPFEVTTK